MINVLMVSPCAGNGGHARYTFRVVSALADVPNVTMHWLSVEDLDDRYTVPNCVHHRLLPAQRPSSTIRSQAGLIANRLRHVHHVEATFLHFLRNTPEQFQVVHFQEFLPWMARLESIVAKRRGAKVVVTAHNLKPHRYLGLPKRLMDGLYNGFYLHADGLVFHTPGLVDRARSLLGALPTHCVAPHGPLSFTAHAAPGGATDGTILLCGQLRRNKGVLQFVAAARLCPDLQFRLVGKPQDIQLLHQLEADIRDVPNLDGALRFVSDEELEAHISAAAVVCLPYTTFEGVSGVLEIALRARKAIVASDVGALSERLSTHQPRVTLPAHFGAPDLAAAVVAAEELAGGVDAGDTDALPSPEWTDHADAVSDLYAALLDDAPARSRKSKTT